MATFMSRIVWRTAALTCLLGSLAACTSTGTSTSERVQSAVAFNLTGYRTAHGLTNGGLAVYLETPAGNHFAASGLPAGVDPASRFRVASNTKTFTSAATLMLAQQGRLNLDDLIVSPIPALAIPYVPAAPEADGPSYDIPGKGSITIRQLLSHTAGVFDVTNNVVPASCPVPYAGQSYPLYMLAADPNHQFSPRELVGVDAQGVLSDFAPGAGYHYSNTGYSILATIIERVSGLPYDQFLLQNLIQPNGLAATTVPMLATERSLPSPFVPGYLYSNSQWKDVTEGNMSVNIAEGNLISTPADLARWVRRLVRGEAGPDAASVSAMLTTTAQSGHTYGLGMCQVSDLGYGHNGAHEGYLSVMAYDPATSVSTVAYCNFWDEDRLTTDQYSMLVQAAKDARTAAGY